MLKKDDGNFDVDRRAEINFPVVKESPTVREEDSPFHSPISGTAAA